MSAPRRFPLAPMDRAMRLLTGVVLVLPVVLVVAAPSGAATRWLVPGGLLALIAVTAAAWRPLAFEVEPGAVVLRYPVRSKRVPLASLESVERLSGAEFRQRFGWALRVGVGGLFGGFGWLRTARGWVEMDVSRTDGFVLLTWRDRVPLLLTPADAEAFVDAVRASAGLRAT